MRFQRLSVTVALGAAMAAALAPPAGAQYPDAWNVPAGALRIGFEPSYLDWSEVFDASGTIRPLGATLSDTAMGWEVLPTLGPVVLGLRALTGDSSLTLNLGAFATRRVADVRNTPLTVALGITRFVTLTAALPIVTTRAQVDFAVDSTNANVGWNQAAAASGSVGGLAQVQAVLGELTAAAAYVDAQIAAGAYGCPGSAQCFAAAAVRDRAFAAATLLGGIAGVGAAGVAAEQPPFAPLAGSPAGTALTTLLQALSTDLQQLGATALTATFPLPSERVGAEAVNTVLTDSAFGYLATPLEFAKYRSRLGDAEVGLRIGLFQGERVRTLLTSTVRLPTGTRDRPEHFVDIGTGDGQIDVIAGIEAVVAPGPVALAFRGSYTAQLPDQVSLRVTTHDRPIVPAGTLSTVTRNLGDVLAVSIYPTVRLTNDLSVYGSAHYMRRTADTYEGGATDPGPLAFETAMQTWSFGAGIHYRAARARHALALPVEAGIDYVSAFHGTGGQTPKTTQLSFYLRLYKRLWGGGAATTEATEAPEATEPEEAVIPPR